MSGTSRDMSLAHVSHTRGQPACFGSGIPSTRDPYPLNPTRKPAGFTRTRARAKEHLQITLEHWALERLFLGALVVASKYLNDSTMKNVHWALCTGIFKTPDIGVMEREFLEVLDFELGVKEHHILFHHGSIMGRLLVDAGWCGRGNKRSGEDINQCPPKRSKMT
ncbi:hypothetical protein B0H10DRAFT_2203014 [Mycena sp. CBHHK59/15]|nr:hypothetical protein B0H10DRAFT_2203014 [Mycena sp. CBHHK59/15]